MITLSYNLFFKILYIVVAVIHFIIYAVIFLKIRGVSKNKTLTVNELLSNIKNGFNKVLNYFAPQFPNIIGLIKQITAGEKKEEKDEINNG